MGKVIVLTGWFFISMGNKDGDVYRYLLQDKVRNIHVALETEKELEYPVGSYGKFIMNAECEQVQTSEIHGQSMFYVNSMFCNADNYKIAPCLRPLIINGVRYCE